LDDCFWVASKLLLFRARVLLPDGFTEVLPCALEIGERHRVIES
jgi:hypothetical protein